MPIKVEVERFVIEDEGDGWIKLERVGGDSMSLLERELPELIDVLRASLVRTRGRVSS